MDRTKNGWIYKGTWKPIYNDYSRITCDLTKPQSRLKSITYKLCENDSEISATKFSATFKNEYNNECTIPLEKVKNQFMSIHVTGNFLDILFKKLYVVSTPLNHLDNCKNFEVTEEVSVWIHNGADALCLSHFYFDIFDIKTAKFKGKLFSFLVYCLSILLNALLIIGSYSSIYRCKFDKDAASKNVDTNGIPLLCSASNIVVNYLV